MGRANLTLVIFLHDRDPADLFWVEAIKHKTRVLLFCAKHNYSKKDYYPWGCFAFVLCLCCKCDFYDKGRVETPDSLVYPVCCPPKIDIGNKSFCRPLMALAGKHFWENRAKEKLGYSLQKIAMIMAPLNSHNHYCSGLLHNHPNVLAQEIFHKLYNVACGCCVNELKCISPIILSLCHTEGLYFSIFLCESVSS